MKKNLTLMISLIFLLILSSCSTKQDKIIIAMSKAKGSKNYERYAQWLEENNKNVKCIDLYFLDSKADIDEVMSKAVGLVLTGGPDVHPGRYGRAFDTARCDIDLKRDTLEFYLIKQAEARNMPILGICRGLQILNIAHGGTLFVDIPSDYGTDVIHRCDSNFCYHYVTLDTMSLLYNIMKEKRFKTNTYHHQGINILADDLFPNARSDDNLVEGIEYRDKESNPFLIAVQWHPERLQSPTSKRLAHRFINECINYKKKNTLQ